MMCSVASLGKFFNSFDNFSKTLSYNESITLNNQVTKVRALLSIVICLLNWQ